MPVKIILAIAGLYIIRLDCIELVKEERKLVLNKNSKLVVICGGFSQEREVSLRSGNNVYQALLRLGYKNTKLFSLDSMEGLATLIKQNIDLAILMTHGKFGEDGQLQAILDQAQIKYTGSPAEASANCMDKVKTKTILKANDLPILETYSAAQIVSKQILVSGPLILKEIDGGSSLGVERFDNQDQLSKANWSKDLSNYFVEKFITGIELTASIIMLNGKLNVLPLLELRSQNQFYDYQAKYTEGMTEFIIPAAISTELTEQIKMTALQAYQALGCQGPARVDFIIDKEKPYILELNTLPGMTSTSDLPAQAKAAGISYDELIEIIIS